MSRTSTILTATSQQRRRTQQIISILYNTKISKMYAIRTLTGRNIRVAATKVSQRQMGGGGGHAAKEWTGIDKVVRGYFPEDYQSTYGKCRSRLIPLHPFCHGPFIFSFEINYRDVNYNNV